MTCDKSNEIWPLGKVTCDKSNDIWPLGKVTCDTSNEIWPLGKVTRELPAALPAGVAAGACSVLPAACRACVLAVACPLAPSGRTFIFFLRLAGWLATSQVKYGNFYT